MDDRDPKNGKLKTIKEGISRHSFYTEIWFNIDPETGEIRGIEWANPNNFRIMIAFKADGRDPYRMSSTKKSGSIVAKESGPLFPGSFLPKTETGFDAPEPQDFEYRFEVYRF